MVRKGLIYNIEMPDKPTLYMAAQFVVGIWEYQVNRLDEGLIRDMNEYLPTFVDLGIWQKAPQLRTIPVSRSLDASSKILSYERAEELVKNRSKIRVVPCICRREHTMVGEGCGRPEESCKKCGICVKRCQMDAVAMIEEKVEVQQERCIGCGLCISTCPTESLTLVRKPEESQTPVPANVLESNILTARARGKMGRVSMAKMTIRSKWDRMLAK